MNLLVHRDREAQEIVRVYQVSDDIMNKGTIGTRIHEYNNSGHKDNVYLHTIDNDSLEAFLFKHREANVRNFREQLKNIQYGIDSLSGDIRWLDRLCEEAANEQNQ